MGQPKHSLKLSDGRAMIEHVADALRCACDESDSPEIIILGDEKLFGDVSLPGVRYLPDNIANLGPLAGIEALLSSGIAKHYLICACDTPMLTAELLRRLRVQTNKPITMFRVEGAEKCEPVPMRIAASTLPNVQQHLQSDDRSIHSFVYSLPREEVVITVEDASRLRNINTPSDFAAVSKSSR